MRVLIVDDEKLARSRLQAILADCSTLPELQISEAADALQAMRILEQQPIDLIFLDIHMPGASGLSLAREIRHLPQVPQIIFVTAHAEHALQAFDLDAIDYLTKPISSARLQKALEKVSRVQQAREQMAQAPEKTLIIHDREAHRDCFDALWAGGAEEVSGVFHAYSGSVEMMHEAVAHGFYIGN